MDLFTKIYNTDVGSGNVSPSHFKVMISCALLQFNENLDDHAEGVFAPEDCFYSKFSVKRFDGISIEDISSYTAYLDVDYEEVQIDNDRYRCFPHQHPCREPYLGKHYYPRTPATVHKLQFTADLIYKLKYGHVYPLYEVILCRRPSYIPCSLDSYFRTKVIHTLVMKDGSEREYTFIIICPSRSNC